MMIRYMPPSKFDHAPLATIAKVMGEGTQYTLYIQISPDDDMPHWIKAGDFLEQVYQEDLMSPSFIKKCLKQYSQQNTPI